jgi:CDP-diacylglycerol--inositol 3-phosphatidyltransferase
LTYHAGYFRVISAIAAMYFSLSDWKLTALLYSVSQGLDAVDGVVARKFNQCTKFGQVLDMLTDRFGFSTFLRILF